MRTHTDLRMVSITPDATAHLAKARTERGDTEMHAELTPEIAQELARLVALSDAYDEEFIAIADLDEWADFWGDNAEALTAEIGDEATCRALAMNCALHVGGGAAPAIRVGFVD